MTTAPSVPVRLARMRHLKDRLVELIQNRIGARLEIGPIDWTPLALGTNTDLCKSIQYFHHQRTQSRSILTRSKSVLETDVGIVGSQDLSLSTQSARRELCHHVYKLAWPPTFFSAHSVPKSARNPDLYRPIANRTLPERQDASREYQSGLEKSYLATSSTQRRSSKDRGSALLKGARQFELPGRPQSVPDQ